MRLDFTLEVPRPRFVVVHYHFFKQERMDDFRSRCAALVKSEERLHLVPLKHSSDLRRAVGQKFTD